LPSIDFIVIWLARLLGLSGGSLAVETVRRVDAASASLVSNLTEEASQEIGIVLLGLVESLRVLSGHLSLVASRISQLEGDLECLLVLRVCLGLFSVYRLQLLNQLVLVHVSTDWSLGRYRGSLLGAVLEVAEQEAGHVRVLRLLLVGEHIFKRLALVVRSLSLRLQILLLLLVLFQAFLGLLDLSLSVLKFLQKHILHLRVGILELRNDLLLILRENLERGLQLGLLLGQNCELLGLV